ncbi:MAG: AmmeMemoRadiSam system protein A [Gammaproteobacteria bacterium]|nr:AmmeMemoRadiSam system protein A [Gammaproteobacteria bacterium]
MPSIDNYSDEQQQILLETAAQSIQHGLQHRSPLIVYAHDFEPALRELRATFVTLQTQGELRGCIGMLKAIKPLIEDVASNAYSAAFNDPRFPPLGKTEFDKLDIHISVLTPARAFPVKDEAELLAKLRPGVDGLILRDGYYQSTFLPSVWESLPTPQAFIMHLKQKAGLSSNYWSDTISFERYETISFGKTVSELTLEKA